MENIAVCTICGESNNKLYVKLEKNSIYECKVCKNAFTFPYPNLIKYEDEDFHGQFHYSNVEELPLQWKKGIKKQGALIEKNFTTKSKVLEIGCGQGLLLGYLKDRGFDVYGIEPSKSAATVALNKNLNVLNGYFPEVNFNKEVEFDLIIMSHVLEHIESPINYIKLLSERFKGKHLLLIQTNYKGFVPVKLKSSWYAWVPEQHYSHFTEEGLRKICTMLGLKFIEAEYSSLEHNGYWLSKLSEVLPKKGDQFHSIIKL